ncbi:MAG: dihydrolipoyl dehydrogenase [Deltaproteobacteria bacterium]|nr:dihydrolipoyl dehydrogenase [Deltaproteobacteria bacterium]
MRAADLGKQVMLIERRERPGGVCLIEGCIPSKTLIGAVEIAETARRAKEMGVTFRDVAIDPVGLRGFTDSVVDGLTGGVAGLLKARKVRVVHGTARFTSSSKLRVEAPTDDAAEVSAVEFEHAIIATGSRPVLPPFAKGADVWTAREALKVPEVPGKLLVVGGGYIGLELGLVYAGLGSKVTVVELLPSLLAGMDQDLVRVVHKSCKERFEGILLETKVTKVDQKGKGFDVEIERKDGATEAMRFDRVFVAVGRQPNTDDIGLEHTKVKTLQHGFIEVDEQRRTADKNIFAIGDVTPGPMLAHKASREGKVAAEVIAGHPSAFDNRAIPAVVFTSPEIVTTGLTETQAKADGIKVKVGRFPLSALGRAKTLGRAEGFAKVLIEPDTGLILGVAMVGQHASELIAEGTLAVEMGATIEDLAATIHPHPTLSEAIMEAAEVAADAAVHIARK